MIERVFLDAAGAPLLYLERQTAEQALFVKSESLPDLVPIGASEDVPGTGMKMFVGERRPRAGQIAVTLGTHGRTLEDAWLLQREVIALAPRIAAYQRIPGGVLGITSYSKVSRNFTGSAQLGGTVEIVLDCASPYFLQDERIQQIAPGSAVPVFVGGQARAGLRVSITAGASAVTNPTILSNAGLTNWQGTIPAGQTLTVDCLGGHDVALSGVDVALYLTGPQPYLDPGDRDITITAAGANTNITWQEGEL